MRTPNIECTIACLHGPVVLDRFLLLRNFANQAPAMNALRAFQGNGWFDSNKHPKKKKHLWDPVGTCNRFTQYEQKADQKLINHLDDCPHHYWNFDHDFQNARQMWVVKVPIAYRGDEIIWILVILHGSQKQLYICILLCLLLLKVCPLLLCIQILWQRLTSQSSQLSVNFLINPKTMKSEGFRPPKYRL